MGEMEAYIMAMGTHSDDIDKIDKKSSKNRLGRDRGQQQEQDPKGKNEKGYKHQLGKRRGVDGPHDAREKSGELLLWSPTKCATAGAPAGDAKSCNEKSIESKK